MIWKNIFNHVFFMNFGSFFAGKIESLNQIIKKLKRYFSKHLQLATKKTCCWFHTFIFLYCKTFYTASEQLIKLKYCFCFRISFFVFCFLLQIFQRIFLVFFCFNFFMEKTESIFVFCFEFRKRFFTLCNICPVGLRQKFY